MSGNLARLFRPRLAFLNAITAAAGYSLVPSFAPKVTIWWICLGVVLLAFAGSAFNQVLERDIDRMMARTRLRPLPDGRLTPTVASFMGGFCLLAGLLFLSAGGLSPVLSGVIALVLYLAIYTPMKRHSPLAPAVGAFCGAIPPFIGWCGAGGNPLDFRIVLLAGLLYLWQIPHFWLLQRRHADDYRRAGIPLCDSQCSVVPADALCRLWIMALIVATLLLPAFGIFGHKIAILCLVFSLPLSVMTLIRFESALFSYLNLFPIVLTMAICA